MINTYVGDDARDGERAADTDVDVFGADHHRLRLDNPQFDRLGRRSLSGRYLQSIEVFFFKLFLIYLIHLI